MKIPHIPTPDATAAAAARQRQDALTKPQGSLGQLEEISIQLAALGKRSIERRAVIVMAADHGVAAEGVSAFPSDVTPQMVLNFLRGGAAINVLARQANARVTVVDIGVNFDFGSVETLHATSLQIRKVARGTRNMAHEAAMTRQETEAAIQVGIDVAKHEIAKGLDIIATGDMGIGNTTPSAAIAAIITGQPVAQITGRGTGIDDAGLARKIATIEKAIALHQPDPKNALDVLSKVGGLEIAGLAGVIIGAASDGIPVVIDGFISGAAALIAYQLAPDVKPYLIAAHQSVEIGHRVMLEHIGLHPLLNLNLRLGEGTGAVLAFHLIEGATRILNEMATFEEAGVSGKE